MSKTLPFNKSVIFLELCPFNALVINGMCAANYTNRAR
jgi:hypothetical protein